MKKTQNYYPGIMAFVFFSLFAPVFANAGSPSLAKPQSVINGPDWSFRENKGQLLDENRQAISDIKYYGRQGGVNIYCKPGEISFVFNRIEGKKNVSEASGKLTESELMAKNENREVTLNRAELQLLNANLSAEITATDQQEYYENYYNTGDASKGTCGIYTFSTITYKNIYPNIDLILHAKAKSMKYEFIVNPGGNVTDIQMQWNGLNNIKSLENGGISYALALVNMTESAPYTYQGGVGVQNIMPLQSSFFQNGNHISFKVSNYDKSQSLTIDPTLTWGTYFGDSGSTFSQAIALDSNNNVYITGSTVNTSGIATTGAYLTTNSGNYDAFIASFNSSGNILWATYYGGNDADLGYGINIDGNNNIYITGYTKSISGIATSGAYQTSNGGGYSDAFVAKFTSSGSLTWGTYFGGSGDEHGNGITTDAFNNVYVAGQTSSATSIATSGSYQTSFGGGRDAFVAEFTSAGNLSWATYFGGSGNDGANGIVTDLNSNVYITGSTTSTSGIATKGAHKTSFGGTGSNGYGDAFVAQFTTAGSLSWATYFGDSADDEGTAITTDNYNNVYITGQTQSQKGIATTGAYQTSLGGDFDAFLVKYTSSDSLVWATYYGGYGADEGLAITTDAANDIYITGYTNSTSGISTPGAYQANYSPVNTSFDVFVSQFNSLGFLYLGSYNGGSNTYNSAGNGITIDANNNIYVTGYTSSDSGTTTTGTYEPNYSYQFDAFVQVFNIPFAGIKPVAANTFGLKTSPNPFADQVTVSYTISQNQNVQIILSDITGKQIATIVDENQLPGNYLYTLEAAKYNIPAGVYFLNMVAGNESAQQKIVKIK